MLLVVRQAFQIPKFGDELCSAFSSVSLVWRTGSAVQMEPNKPAAKKVSDLGFRVRDSGRRAWGSGFRIEGLGFWI